MLLSISDWWEGMSNLQQIYWAIAIPSTLIFLIQAVLIFIGGDLDMETDVDMEIETDTGTGFQFFSIKNFIGFFTLFSWTGIACLQSGLGLGLTLLFSTLAGLLMMALMASIFFYFSKLAHSGTMDFKNAIGGVGEVYMLVQAKRGNIGKVHVKVQGSLRELDAITDDTADLTQGTVVTIKNVINDSILLITKNGKQWEELL
ncbi:MAG: hypothetical protein KTR13_05765 [Saprospiraceae bacterium]|nr:hypothetical protein [Saprospiraceae bacterium]